MTAAGVGEKRSGLFRDRFRFFIVILGTLCLTSIFSNTLTLNFTLICMESAHGNVSHHDLLKVGARVRC